MLLSCILFMQNFKVKRGGQTECIMGDCVIKQYKEYPIIRLCRRNSKGTVKRDGQQKRATCFAKLLQNELNSDFALF